MEHPKRIAPMKKQQFKYASIYLPECGETVIDIFDRKKDAMKDAMETLEESLADYCDSEENRDARTNLRKRGIVSLDEDEVKIGILKCRYHPSES